MSAVLQILLVMTAQSKYSALRYQIVVVNKMLYKCTIWARDLCAGGSSWYRPEERKRLTSGGIRPTLLLELEARAEDRSDQFQLRNSSAVPRSSGHSACYAIRISKTGNKSSLPVSLSIFAKTKYIVSSIHNVIKMMCLNYGPSGGGCKLINQSPFPNGYPDPVALCI